MTNQFNKTQIHHIPLFHCRQFASSLILFFGFNASFETAWVISGKLVLWADKTSSHSWSSFCTVNCRPAIGNYQLSPLRSSQDSNYDTRGVGDISRRTYLFTCENCDYSCCDHKRFVKTLSVNIFQAITTNILSGKVVTGSADGVIAFLHSSVKYI